MQPIDEKTLNFIRTVPLTTQNVCDTLSISTSTYHRNVNDKKLKPINTVGDLIDYLQLRNIDMLY
jgi:hypothetical protein